MFGHVKRANSRGHKRKKYGHAGVRPVDDTSKRDVSVGRPVEIDMPLVTCIL